MIYKIQRYEVPVYNGYFDLTLPKFSEIVGVLANQAEPGKTPIQVIVEESIPVDGEEVETREAKLLVVADGSPYGEALQDGEFLMYLGFAMWDNGHRINHIFEVINEDLEIQTLSDAMAIREENEEPLIEINNKEIDISELVKNFAALEEKVDTMAGLPQPQPSDDLKQAFVEAEESLENLAKVPQVETEIEEE